MGVSKLLDKKQVLHRVGVCRVGHAGGPEPGGVRHLPPLWQEEQRGEAEVHEPGNFLEVGHDVFGEESAAFTCRINILAMTVFIRIRL